MCDLLGNLFKDSPMLWAIGIYFMVRYPLSGVCLLSFSGGIVIITTEKESLRIIGWFLTLGASYFILQFIKEKYTNWNYRRKNQR